MAQRNVLVPQRRSQHLVHGVAATLRRREREAAGLVGDDKTATAGRRLQSLQRSLARMLQQAHLESVQEPAVGQ